jgi:hypothetical protein
MDDETRHEDHRPHHRADRSTARQHPRTWWMRACRMDRESTRSFRPSPWWDRWSRCGSSLCLRLRSRILIAFGTATGEMFEFLKACVEARLNIFVSGGTGSGKTTTLNVMSSFIPSDERIVTIEDAAELQLARTLWCDSRRGRRTSRPGRDSDPRARQNCAAHAPRPDRGRRGPRRRGSRHAPGNEHRPRWLDVDRACQQPA